MLLDVRLDLALGDAGGEGDRVLHRLHLLGELALVVRARLADEAAEVGNDVRGAAALDRADVRRRLLVDAAEPHLRDRARCGGDRRAPVLREHAGVRGAAVEDDLEHDRRGRAEDHAADRLGLVVDVARCVRAAAGGRTRTRPGGPSPPSR